jgi:hypothetical protein
VTNVRSLEIKMDLYCEQVANRWRETEWHTILEDINFLIGFLQDYGMLLPIFWIMGNAKKQSA